MSKSRAPIYIGLAAAGGIGYYLYGAGGNAEAAKKQAESDAHRAAADIRSHLPGRAPTNVEQDAKNIGKQAGAKFDNALAEADKQASIAKDNAQAYAKEARAETLKAVDKFDHKVEEGAAKAKSSVWGWLGGSK